MTRHAPLWLQSGSYAGSDDRGLPGALWPTARASGCAVSASSGMALNIDPGYVAVPTPNNTGTSLCRSDAVEVVTLDPAPAAGTNRIDLVVCHARGTDLDGGVNNDFVFEKVTGTGAASPVAPATPAGTVALANVYVGGGVAAIVAGNITDVRPAALDVPPALPAGYPRGYVWSLKGPASLVTVSNTSAQSIISGSFPTVAGRRYRVDAYAGWYCTVAAATQHQLRLDVPGGGARQFQANGSYGPNGNIWSQGATFDMYLGTGAPATYGISMAMTQPTNAVANCAANNFFLMASDIGV